MNVGDYVRTIYGISKYKKIVPNAPVIQTDRGFAGEDEIIKSSPNIIDLIEVGDYVNGDKVVNFMLNNNLRAGVIVDSSHYGYNFDEIKLIVTKEQFENMEYKVGE